MTSGDALVDGASQISATPAASSDVVEERVQALLAECPPDGTNAVTFLGAQFDAGLAWVHFPVGHGGLGLSPNAQRTINERIASAGGPSSYRRNPIGHGMGAPTVVTHGSDQQKSRYLRPLFTGEEVWCQLFSEPRAGSDVAGLASRAVRDGGEWVVNGQKVWTTLAHTARWGMLVARTDPAQPKHKGLTYFVVDMHAPGVEVRPLRQMTGEAEFNEVFFTDVRIPDDERLGDEGEGWRVSLTTLMNERVSMANTSIAPRGSGSIAEALALWRRYGHKDASRRDRLMRLWIGAEVNRLTSIRASQTQQQGVPGPEGSTGKLAFAELNKAIHEFCMELMGADAMLYTSYEMVRPDVSGVSDSPQKAFLRARANSLEGGTSEIMRNILAERVLGLPGDVRVDKDVAWIDVPR